MFEKVLNIHKQICSTFRRYSSTIFALSSGHGRCGVAVIRVSGQASAIALKEVTGLKELPTPRTTLLKRIKHPKTKEDLDKGLVVWFPGPRSFTGEDSFELHVHGGIAVINSVLEALGSIEHCRLAEPGEFTKRAFNNGKLDLTEVEGLADLLQAETELQRKQAFLQTQGALSAIYNKWKKVLMKCVANVEAHIDFEETETLETGLLHNVKNNIKELIEGIQKHLKDGRKGEMLRNGVRTVILGEPNAGKSSLLNLICQRPAAIVTPIAGTTRDILEVTLNIGGYPLVLADTAGLRSKTSDIIEQEGISRALQSYKDADLIILVVDCGKMLEWLRCNSNKNLSDFLEYYIKFLNLKQLRDLQEREHIVVLNKIDLLESLKDINIDYNVTKLSCKTEEGLNELIDSLSTKLKSLCGEPSAGHPSMNQRRHRQHVEDCLKCLELALKELEYINEESADLVLMAEQLRRAMRHLGKLVGTVTSEDLLDIIFRDFCIGK